MNPCGPGEQNREQLGRAVNRQPADKIDRQAALRKHPEHRAEQCHIVNQQQDTGDGKGKAERKSEDRDLRVVAEQKGREHTQSVAFLPAKKRAAQGFCARAWHPDIRKVARHQGVKPVAVAGDQYIANRGSRDHHEQRNPDIELDRAHRPAPATAKKTAEPAAETGLGAIDQKIGAQRQPFEIVDQAGIERIFPGNRQARQQRPVKRRQGEHVVIRQAPGLALLHFRDNIFQTRPVRFPLQPETIAAQQRCAQGLLATHRLPRLLMLR